ncbi:MAG: hypothetical protein ACQEQ4_02605 [Fibrobacterota bacterium]
MIIKSMILIYCSLFFLHGADTSVSWEIILPGHDFRTGEVQDELSDSTDTAPFTRYFSASAPLISSSPAADSSRNLSAPYMEDFGIHFEAKESFTADILVYTVSGKKLLALRDKTISAGKNTVPLYNFGTDNSLLIAVVRSAHSEQIFRVPRIY